MQSGAQASSPRPSVAVTGRISGASRNSPSRTVAPDRLNNCMADISPLPQSMRKDIRALHKKSHRDSERAFILEGEKLVGEALDSGAALRLAVVHDEPSAGAQALAERCAKRGVALYRTARRHFEALCDTNTPQSILAVAEYPSVQLNTGGPVVVLDGVADPGNVGTIIRTAEWFGYAGVLLGPGCADRFHPKTLRSTMGSVFRIAVEPSDSLAADIARRLSGHAVYGAALGAPCTLGDIVPPLRHTVVLGSESHGISDAVRSVLTEEFAIPGYGGAESLNVAVAAGICLYHCSTAARR